MSEPTEINILMGVRPRPHPCPDEMWLSKFKPIPHDKIPKKYGDMDVTPELLDLYKGHEVLLKQRSTYPPYCYRAFDDMRLCILQKVDPDSCRKMLIAFQPCAKEARNMRSKSFQDAEKRRKSIETSKSVENASNE